MCDAIFYPMQLLECFSKAVLRLEPLAYSLSKETTEREQQLVWAMSQNYRNMFRVPVDLQREVELHLQQDRNRQVHLLFCRSFFPSNILYVARKIRIRKDLYEGLELDMVRSQDTQVRITIHKKNSFQGISDLFMLKLISCGCYMFCISVLVRDVSAISQFAEYICTVPQQLIMSVHFFKQINKHNVILCFIFDRVQLAGH